jgi:hypothetical protein
VTHLFILHFSPVEMYPPIQNLISVLASRKNVTLKVFTTNAVNSRNVFAADQTEICRVGKSGPRITQRARFLSYIFFNVAALWKLLVEQPNAVLYYETLSAFPVYLYKRFFNRSAKVFIHYHEYMSPAEYAKGMTLVKWFYALEKYLYRKAHWISHTNDRRLTLFCADNGLERTQRFHAVPNFPLQAWHRNRSGRLENRLRIVYVGALNIQTMFVREFATWVANEPNVEWDIFAHNPDEETITFLKTFPKEKIKLKETVDYQSLPDILTRYHVGVILYKGHIPNFVYNAPNKFFEYVSCGLSVWFPSVMLGMQEYERLNSFPEVRALDFSNLGIIPWPDDDNAKFETTHFTAERAFSEMVSQLSTASLNK